MAFPTTNWNLLAAATLDGDPAGRAALEHLCQSYYAPIRNFLRSRGFSEERAADGTQEFFRELLTSRAWKRADSARGRFRTFLLGALMHVLTREQARNAAEKRGSGIAPLSLDEIGEGADLDRTEDSAVFDREWARQLMAAAMAAVKCEFTDAGRDGEWPVLVQFLPGAGETPTYEEAAARLGISLSALKKSIHRLRQKFRGELRAATARTVGAAHEIDEELAYLHRILSARGG